jgi:hypothetical protein
MIQNTPPRMTENTILTRNKYIEKLVNAPKKDKKRLIVEENDTPKKILKK